jgi:hypothetical protein
MPETPSRIVTFNKFNLGDYGTTAPEQAPAGSFKARNMLVYADGSIGPRAGLRDVTPASMPTGELLTLQSTPVVGRDGLFIIGDTVYRYDFGTPATAPSVVGTLDTAPTMPLRPYALVDDFYMAVPADKCYRLDVTNDQVDGISGSPSGTNVVIWNDQLIVVSDTATNQLLASLPGDVNDFSEGRFIAIGDRWEITAIFVQRNFLAVLKRDGIHVVSGVIGDADTEQTRTVSTSTATFHPWNAGRDDLDGIWFIPVFRDNVATFSGATLLQLPQLVFDEHEHETDPLLPLLQSLQVLQGDQSGTSVVAVRAGSTQQALAYHNKAWSVHNFETTVSGMTAAAGEKLIITDGGAAGVAAKIFTTSLQLNRPGFVSDTLASPGDDSATPLVASLTLPQWWNTSGREMTVRQVIVDFKSWDTGTAETNHFDIAVRSMGSQVSGERVYASGTAPLSFDEVVGSSSTSGTRRRKVFNFACAPGAGFELEITNVRGCSFRSFTVLGENHDESPAA